MAELIVVHTVGGLLFDLLFSGQTIFIILPWIICLCINAFNGIDIREGIFIFSKCVVVLLSAKCCLAR